MKKLFTLFISTAFNNQKLHKKILKLMGCRFDITVFTDDSSIAIDYISLAIEEISRIEKLISSWDANSQASEIIKNTGIKSGSMMEV